MADTNILRVAESYPTVRECHSGKIPDLRKILGLARMEAIGELSLGVLGPELLKDKRTVESFCHFCTIILTPRGAETNQRGQ